MKLTAKATIQIQKPKNEVFDAIVNPNKMNQYFIASSTGAIETGKIIEPIKVNALDYTSKGDTDDIKILTGKKFETEGTAIKKFIKVELR